MNMSVVTNASRLIKEALQEDLKPHGDITSSAIIDPGCIGTARILAKQTGVICGTHICRMVFERVDPDVQVNCFVQEGNAVTDQDVIMTISGKTRSLLQAERTALNFLGRLSGIATLTRQYVDAVSHTQAKCLDTRKTTPGWRQLEKYAVTCGGGVNHRMGLYDMFLIKENHIRAAGGIENAVQRCREYMKHKTFQAIIEVEATSFSQVEQASSLKVDRIMLDNMTVEEMKTCVHFIDNRMELEASGNISLNTVPQVAETGIQYISVGALTHSAGTFDVSLLLDTV